MAENFSMKRKPEGQTKNIAHIWMAIKTKAAKQFRYRGWERLTNVWTISETYEHNKKSMWADTDFQNVRPVL